MDDGPQEMQQDPQSRADIKRRAVLRPIYYVASACLAIAFAGGAIALSSIWGRFIGLMIIWLVSGAACGAFLGLLFGVPKRNRDSKSSAEAAASPKPDATPATKTAARTLGYGGNSNFEEISDWLTKIIVGATLVSLQSALKAVWRLAKSVLPLGAENVAAGASLVVGAAVIGTVGGFISMYLWSRTELPRILDGAESPTSPDNVAQEVNRPRDNIGPVNPVRVHTSPVDGLVSAGKAVPVASAPFRPIGQAPWLVEMASMTAEEVWNADFNKGKFGGVSETLSRKLSAVITKVNDDSVNLTLFVQSTNAKNDPLKGKVIFYLHPTFVEPIVKVDAVESRAQTRICTADAFVVGVECDDGRTVLELDLATVKGFPRALGGR